MNPSLLFRFSSEINTRTRPVPPRNCHKNIPFLFSTFRRWKMLRWKFGGNVRDTFMNHEKYISFFGGKYFHMRSSGKRQENAHGTKNLLINSNSQKCFPLNSMSFMNISLVWQTIFSRSVHARCTTSKAFSSVTLTSCLNNNLCWKSNEEFYIYWEWT